MPASAGSQCAAHHHPSHSPPSLTHTHRRCRVEVVSAAFEGKGAVQRHRLVYSLLQPEIDAGVHALALKTKTPAEQQQAAAGAGAAAQQGGK